jgi:hypothetical protein
VYVCEGVREREREREKERERERCFNDVRGRVADGAARATYPQARTELTLASEWNKGTMLLDVDAESREQSWMTPLLHGAPDVDFTDPEEDEYNVQVLVEWLGNRGKVRPPAARPPVGSPFEPLITPRGAARCRVTTCAPSFRRRTTFARCSATSGSPTRPRPPPQASGPLRPPHTQRKKMAAHRSTHNARSRRRVGSRGAGGGRCWPPSTSPTSTRSPRPSSRSFAPPPSPAASRATLFLGQACAGLRPQSLNAPFSLYGAQAQKDAEWAAQEEADWALPEGDEDGEGEGGGAGDEGGGEWYHAEGEGTGPPWDGGAERRGSLLDPNSLMRRGSLLGPDMIGARPPPPPPSRPAAPALPDAPSAPVHS